jgi:bifunctional UDP-N-acetylglucosamine pyrophosphorylase/glucosamine-1-phosphate N-acetyltransferase
VSHNRPAAVIVLAAGEGTRMKSRTPKVLHSIGGRSLIGHALAAAQALEPARLAVVVRHERDRVAAHVSEIAPSALIADQDEIKGTGRAVQCAMSVLDAAAVAERVGAGDGVPADGVEGSVVVLAGDVPLLDGETLHHLVDAHADGGNAVTILTTEVEDPTGYGRIVRDPRSGDVAEIVEHGDATAEQRDIREINSSVYVFDAAVLRAGLSRLGSSNVQGEVYLTDVIGIARTDGRQVRAVPVDDPMLLEGVNDRARLAVLGAELNRRILESWMFAGVTVVDPASTWVDVDVRLESDVTLLPGTQLHGGTIVHQGATVGPDCTLTDVEVGEGATVIRAHAFSSRIGAGASVGPFAYLRPGTVLGDHAKIGTFVEAKNSEIGAGSKVPHLSYVGDATIGEHSNIGAASVFVNFDGVRKHRTQIGSYARTGSDNMFVAPVSVGDGAYTGAGTVVRRNVPPGALAVNVAPQRNIDGWVIRQRAGTPAAEAAEAALAAASDGSATISAQARHERSRATDRPDDPAPARPPADASGAPGTGGAR